VKEKLHGPQPDWKQACGTVVQSQDGYLFLLPFSEDVENGSLPLLSIQGSPTRQRQAVQDWHTLPYP
jgi:hypothetical protein